MYLVISVSESVDYLNEDTYRPECFKDGITESTFSDCRKQENENMRAQHELFTEALALYQLCVKRVKYTNLHSAKSRKPKIFKKIKK